MEEIILTESDKERLAAERERIFQRLTEKPPSFISTVEGLEALAHVTTIAREALRRLTRAMIGKFFEHAVEYQKRGYPYGKTQRGLKKWLKKDFKRNQMERG